MKRLSIAANISSDWININGIVSIFRHTLFIIPFRFFDALNTIREYERIFQIPVACEFSCISMTKARIPERFSCTSMLNLNFRKKKNRHYYLIVLVGAVTV